MLYYYFIIKKHLRLNMFISTSMFKSTTTSTSMYIFKNKFIDVVLDDAIDRKWRWVCEILSLCDSKPPCEKM